MADEKRDLPEVPPKLTLWQRLSSKAYEEAMAGAAEYRANLEAVMREVEAKAARFAAREKHIGEDRRDIIAERQELERREASIAAREDELRAREEAVKARETEIGSRENAAAAQIIAGKQAEKLFREKEEIPPEVSTSSLERDETIKQAILKIKETAEKLRQLTVMNKGREITPDETTSLNSQKANLRAALLATICAYRDTLPEMDRLAFSINGKSCSVFLQEQTQLIAKETQGMHLESDDLTLSREELEIIDTTYKQVAKVMGLDARYAYKGSAYIPFSGNMNITDRRNAGAAVFEHCKNGAPVGLELFGYYAKTPRSTTEITQTTPVETEINSTVKTTDDWDK